MRSSRLGRGAIAVAIASACSAGDLLLPASGTPVELRVVSGDDQRAEAGSLLPESLAVQVLDSSARPVGQATVVFGFVGELDGAGVDPSFVLTNEEGRASAVVRLGAAPGEQLIVAQVANTSAPDLRARFTVTAVQPDDDDDEAGGKGKEGKGDEGGD